MSAHRMPLPAPLPAEPHRAELMRWVDGLEADALWWLSGYAAALAQTRTGRAPASAVPESPPQARLSIVYGSQTGNARRVAEQLAHDAEAAGLAVRLLRADAYPVRELGNERLLYLVLSTQGDGDPSDDAQALVEHLHGRRAPKLPQLRYAVLGLGDSSYPQFCVVGTRLDQRLAELGAQRLIEAGSADLDIDTVAGPWRARAVQAAGELLEASAPLANVTPLRAVQPAAPAWTRERPFAAEVLLNQRITARDSRKDVRHIELSLAGSGLQYAPGDAIGIWPRNPASLVDAVIDTLGLDGDIAVSSGDQSRPLREWLAAHRELTRLSRPTLAELAARTTSDELPAILQPGNESALRELLESHQLIDVLRRWPVDLGADALVAALRPLVPRLYSIASSARQVGDEAHLTVDVVGYQAFGHDHLGAASGFLADLAEGATLPLYIESNERFRLPQDSSRDIIMIGPGTGVAPFRGFVQERVASGARGRNWLLFGNPHFRSDFLYQLEWQSALRDGTLHELDLAFSRDQAERIHVQQRLLQRGAEIATWLDAGAHLYVCGATAMGKDVHAALRRILVQHRSLDDAAAEAQLRTLQQQGRYARDVY